MGCIKSKLLWRHQNVGLSEDLTVSCFLQILYTRLICWWRTELLNKMHCYFVGPKIVLVQSNHSVSILARCSPWSAGVVNPLGAVWRAAAGASWSGVSPTLSPWGCTATCPLAPLSSAAGTAAGSLPVGIYIVRGLYSTLHHFLWIYTCTHYITSCGLYSTLHHFLVGILVTNITSSHKAERWLPPSGPPKCLL